MGKHIEQIHKAVVSKIIEIESGYKQFKDNPQLYKSLRQDLHKLHEIRRNIEYIEYIEPKTKVYLPP